MKNPFKRAQKLKVSGFSSLIACGTVVTGDVSFHGVLMVDGSITGEVIGWGNESICTGTNCLVVSEGATVFSESIHVTDLVIAGHVSGNSPSIVVKGTLKVLKTGKIEDAKITYGQLEIETGAKIHNCQLNMVQEQDVDPK